MRTINQEELAAALDTHLSDAATLHNPVLVDRGGEEADVVIVSEREYRGMLTTIELLSSPVMAERLRRSIAQLDGRAGRAEAAE